MKKKKSLFFKFEFSGKKKNNINTMRIKHINPKKKYKKTKN